MPIVTRAYVFAALLWLLLSLAAGLVLAAPGRFPAAWVAVVMGPGWTHMWALGWLTQLIFGIAWWLLPTIDRQRGRGTAWPLWLGFVCLNLGLPLRLLAEPAARAAPAPAWASIGVLLAAAMLLAAGTCFVIPMWRRVR